MKNLLCLFCLSFSVAASAQKSEYTGSAGEVILVRDSTSFSKGLDLSEFYMVEESSKPYSGILYTHRGIYRDTSQVLSGRKVGLSKSYLEVKGRYELFQLSYTDIGQKISVTHVFSATRKYKHALIVSHTGSKEIKMLIEYKKKGRIVLSENNGGRKTRYKFESKSDLRFFIDQMSSPTIRINSYCELVGVFS